MKSKRLKFIFLFCLLNLICSAQTIWYVTENGNGNMSGTSWSNASKDLQATINSAASGDEIWVARGTYLPMRPANNLNTIDLENRNNAFVLKKDVKIYGGFSGVESNLNQRNWNYNITILSGDIGYKGENSDNCYHVVISVNDLGYATVDGFIISDGKADDPSSSIVVNGSTVNNGSGGGMYYVNSDPNPNSLFNHLIIKYNEAFDFGGGVYTESSILFFINSLFYLNYASDGGAIYSSNSYITLINSTITYNIATNKGGGMNIELLEGYNCIIAQNEANQGKDLNLETGISYSLANCLVGDSNGITETVGGINVILNQDPAFENPSGENFKLSSNSPAINTGDSSFYNQTQYSGFDLEGNDRILEAVIDMGAYEYKAAVTTINFTSGDTSICEGESTNIMLEIQSIELPPFQVEYDQYEDGIYVGSSVWNLDSVGINTIQSSPLITTTYKLKKIIDNMGNETPASDSLTIDVQSVFTPTNGRLYVNKNILTSGNGSSWDEAVKELADAIQFANTCGKGLVSEIWVAQGTYYPLYAVAPTDRNGNPTTHRDNAFVLPKDVKIYGGFSGSETDVSQRDWRNNPTVLDGDGDENPGDSSDNNYHIVIAAGDLGNTILDGFYIQYGYADGTSSTIIDGVEIFQNKGGGIYNTGSSPTYQNLYLNGNLASDVGGGILLDNQSAALFNKLIIEGNISMGNGGGVYMITSSSTFANTLIVGNTSYTYGGGMCFDGSKDTLVNVSVISNLGVLNGDAFAFIASGNPVIKNTVAWGLLGTDIIEINGSNPFFLSTLIQDHDLGVGNFDGTDYQYDPIFDSDFMPTSGIIDIGDNSLYNTALYTNSDLIGNSRIVGTIDLGAFEIPCASNPTASFTTPDTVSCGGNISLNIHISDAVFPCSIEYSDDGGNTTHQIAAIQESDIVLVVAPDTTTTYSLMSITDANNCSIILSSSVNVVVDPLIITPITGDTTVCVGNIIQLTNTTPNGIWSSNQPTVANIDSNGLLTGIAAGNVTITYTATNSNGCTNFTSRNVEVEDCATSPFSAQFTSSEVTVCAGEIAFMNINITGGTAPYSITYEENGIRKTIQNIASNNYSLKVTPNSTTVYTLTGISDNTGLQNNNLTSSFTVKISTPPTIGHLSTPPPACPGGYLNIAKPVFLLNRGLKVAEGWLLNGKPFNPETDPISLDDHGKSLAYWIENNCGRTTSNSVTITVNRSSIVVQDIGIGCVDVVNLNLAIVSIIPKSAVLFYWNPNDTKPIEDPTQVKVSTTEPTTFYVKIASGASSCDNGEFVSFKVFPSKAIQKIYFEAIENKTLDSPDFDPGATSSSGLPVQYTSSNPEVAIILNGKIHITGSGQTLITASQPGNDCFLPAEIVTQILTIDGTDENKTLLENVTIDGINWANINETYVICESTKKMVNIKLDVVPGAIIDKGESIVFDITEWGLKVFQFTVTLKNKKEFYTLHFDKRINFKEIAKLRWDNTFAVINNPKNNGGLKLTEYKWFKNEKEVGYGPYYSVNNQVWDKVNPKDLYRVQVKTDKGQIINSCYWDGVLDNRVLTAYPNPVQTNQMVYVETDISELVYNEAFIDMYNAKGQFIQKQEVKGRTTPIEMPSTAGIYILNLTIDKETIKTFKIIVKN